MSFARLAIGTLGLTASLGVTGALASAQSTTADSGWREVSRILQTPAVAIGGYQRFNLPRRDITLKMGDVSVSPAIALGGWAGFAGTLQDAMVMGDLVVTSAELKPVLAELERQHLDVTSIHNHLAGEQPAITYIHFHGAGVATDLATRLDRAVAKTAVPRPVLSPTPVALTVDTARVFKAMGTTGRAQGSVAQLSFMLVKVPVTMHGAPLVPALAYGSPVNLQMVDATRAVATGDFAVLEGQVAPIVTALARNGITATAVHSHLIGETPRLYYIHFWADGALDDVLRGLKAAVDAAAEPSATSVLGPASSQSRERMPVGAAFAARSSVGPSLRMSNRCTARRSSVHAAGRTARALTLLAAITVTPSITPLVAQQPSQAPSLRVGAVSGHVRIDGRLDEPFWNLADSIADLTQIEPVERAAPSARTVVRVVATSAALIIGIRADDAEPGRLTSFARERDAALANEDHLKIVLDTYRDGRSGYVFAVNPNGARYDALVANQGEGENANWDAVWEAATARTATGWSLEIRIPVQSLQFRAGLREWGFNVQRRVQRLLETDRWSSPERNFQVTQSFRAGRLTDVPDFSLGLGLSVRPSLVAGGGVAAPQAKIAGTRDASLDVTQALGANTLAALTVNTDFAETEVDTRRTNLTRFPLVFPEKRTFFLQGADIFDFGLGTGDDVRPFFSRRIGLLDGEQVPIRAGLKVSGRGAGANYGALILHTGDIADREALGLPQTSSTMGVLRVKQNVLRESSVGFISTVGDPLGRTGAWTTGADATFQTSRLGGDKNFLVGVWGLATGREGLRGGERTAFGGKLDYPNDLWDVAFTFRRVGGAFDPSLGFIPRPAVQAFNLSVTYQPRPQRDILGLDVRQMFHEFLPTLVTDLGGKWESYRVFMAPINWRLESGDRFEFNANPTGERLVEPFEIAPGVAIPVGAYHWMRYRFEAGFAPKRRLSGQATWWTGGFYTGRLDELQLTGAWKPSPLFIVELNATRNIGRLPQGDFTQDLIGTRLRVNVSPNLQYNSYLQYDNESDTFGANTRVRWTFSPQGDLFLVYNHNLRHDIDPITGRPVDPGRQTDPTRRLDRRWGFGSNQLLVKVQYALRY